MRVLLVISNLEYGGAQRQVVELANHLDVREFDVHICSLSEYMPLADSLRDAGCRLHIIRKKWKFDFTVVPRLVRLLRSLRADIVQGYLFDAEIAARLAGRLAGTPVIIGSERNTDYTLKRRQLAVYRLTRGCVDLIVANSNAGADFNSRTLGHPRFMYRVVHNGVDTERFSPGDGGPGRRRIGLAEDELVVGMFGSFKQQKNHPLLFRAARLVLRRLPQTRFLFVGDELYGGMHGSDQYKREMDALVSATGIRDRCLFLGNRDDVAELYRVCDVTVLPSLFEGTPNVLLESMACGVPVIATDVSDNSYVVPDRVAGYIVPPGDETILAARLRDMLETPAVRQELAHQAREWVLREFSIERLAARTAAVYQEALVGRSTRL